MDPSQFYLAKYQQQLDWQESWLRFSAQNKADSIEHLLSRRSMLPHRIMDLGCGTGAVLLELRRRGIGQEFYAVDISSEALASLSEHAPDVNCQQAGITQPWSPPAHEFDCVVLSHVIEHLSSPACVLRSLPTLLRFKHLIIEVPLEDLPAARFKNLFRDRLANQAGHVQFFRVSSFRTLIESSGYTIVDERIYCPVLTPAILDAVSRQDRFSRSRKAIYTLTNIYGPKYLQRPWSRFYHGHYAILAYPNAGASSIGSQA